MSAIEKTLDILETVQKYKREISIVDLSKAVEQRISTTHRICSILVERGYL
jgi:DNA-binding IclR family transcriptional regulator